MIRRAWAATALVPMAISACPLHAAEDAALLFRSDFDAYSVRAKFGKGGVKPSGFGEESLQLRMWDGPYGNVNALAYTKSETCAYPLKGNFDPRQGTVSFWIASLGWKPSAKTFQWFVSAGQPGFDLNVYKYHWGGYLFFLIRKTEADGTVTSLKASARIEDGDWTEGRWHKIDATWNAMGMQLYVDGVLPKAFHHEGTAPAVPAKKFLAPVAFPEAADGTLAINAHPTKAGPEKEERTALDELVVLSRPLSAKEVLEAYVKVVPNAAKTTSLKPVLAISLATVAVTPDGRVGADEWADASVAPLALVAPFSKVRETALRGTVRVKRDKDSLYVALEANRPPRRRKVTAHDGALWEDDSFELALAGKDGSLRHLIVNANGAVYDALNGCTAWNPRLQSAASVSSAGWAAELVVSLEDLGGLPATGTFGLSAYRSDAQNDIESVSWALVSDGGYPESANRGVFVATEKPISLYRVGRLEAGQVALDVRGAADFTAFVECDNGERTTAVDLGRTVWNYAPPPGKYVLSVEGREKDGRTVLRWAKDFYVNREVELAYDCHTLEDRHIAVSATLSGALAAQVLKDPVAGVLRLVRNADGKTLAETKVVAKTTTVLGRLPLPNLEPGDYLVEAAFGEEKADRPFVMPDLSPLQCRVAVDHTVPPPWHAVRKADGRTWVVLDRTYAFGDGPFPQQVVSRGQELFVHPPAVRLDGRGIAWSDFSVVSNHADAVSFVGKGRAGRLSFDWTSELWFDGLYILKLKAVGEGNVSSFDIAYSVPREQARYVFRQGYRDALWTWKDDRIGKVFSPVAHPDSSLHWTSGPEVGLAFGSPSDANWANRPDEENVVYTRTDKTVTLTAKVISRPVEVTKPLAWIFVLQGTPARRPDANWRAINLGGYRRPTMQNRQYGGYGERCYADQRTPDRWTTPSSYVFKWPDRFRAEHKKTARQTQSHVPWLFNAYCMPCFLGDNEPEFDYFFHDAIKTPTFTWGYRDAGVKHTEYCVCDTRLHDVWLDRMERFFRETGSYMGIYNDCAGTMNCDNERHGHGGVDAFGKRFSTAAWLQHREYYLREFKLVRKYGRGVRNHVAAANFIPFVQDFSDEMWPGEEHYASVLESLDCYTEVISPEVWQSAFNATVRGVPSHVLVQYGRAADALDGERRKIPFTKDPQWAERVMAAALVHDVPVSAHYIDWKTVDRWWIVKESLKLWDATFHGYWFDDTLKSPTKGMYVSWYDLPEDAPYLRLVVAANFTRQDAPLALRPPWKTGEVRELWNDRDVADLATLVVPAKKFVLLGLR